MQTISSKDVAGMLGKRHDNFLREIRKYISNLGEEANKYFVETSYKDSIGRNRACYGITLEGCEFLSGLMIGKKSTEFKEKYTKILGKCEEPEEKEEEKIYSVKEVAKMLGISERTVYRNIENGKLHTIQREVISTVIAVTESDLNAFKVERGM